MKKSEMGYHQVATCANCQHCQDVGIDEEAFICQLIDKVTDDIFAEDVEHDFICLYYLKEDE